MERNMGTLDRIVRSVLIAPAALVGAYVLGFGTAAGIALVVVAALMLVTSAVGYCPLYALLRIRTLGPSHRT